MAKKKVVAVRDRNIVQEMADIKTQLCRISQYYADREAVVGYHAEYLKVIADSIAKSAKELGGQFIEQAKLFSGK